MTNETTASQPCPTCAGSKVDPGGLPVCRTCTASQPKSIGDDAPRGSGIKDWLTDYNEGRITQDEFILLLNSRAPAAQASATIQAAPVGWRDKLRWSKANIDMHGYIAFTPAQLEHFVSMLCAPAATIQEPVMVAEPVAWRIGMIVHHDKAKAELDSIHWNVPLEPLYLAAPIVSQPVESKPLYLVKFDGTEAWKEASEDAYWTFSERNRKIVYELAAPIVAEPVSHELMQQLGTMRAVGAAPMVADPAGVAEESGLDHLEQLARAATQGQWEYGYTTVETQQEAVDICRDNISATAKPTDKFYEVFLMNGLRTALIGNGPTSAANAEYIASLHPANILHLISLARRTATVKAIPSEALDDPLDTKLPCDVVIGNMTIRKGVRLGTLVGKAQRDNARMKVFLNTATPEQVEAFNALVIRPDAAPLADKTGGGE